MGISIGNKIELVHLNQIIRNEQNKKVYVSKIYDIMPGNMLQIAMPIYEGKIVPLSVDEKYSACFYTEKGLLQCNVLITSRYKSGNLFFLEVLMINDLAKVQRREFYRYKCRLEGKIRIVSDEEFNIGRYTIEDIPENDLPCDDVIIIDISGGGARIFSKKHIDKNEVIKLRFQASIPDEIFCFNLYGRILSSVQSRTNNSLYEQRIEFMKISQEERDKIIKYIFENERIARAKGSGMK